MADYPYLTNADDTIKSTWRGRSGKGMPIEGRTLILVREYHHSCVTRPYRLWPSFSYPIAVHAEQFASLGGIGAYGRGSCAQNLENVNMAANGYNPMRWDCETKGCFNKRKRPKIEVFANNFPGKINFSDVDGIVEISGNALMLEWKDYGVPLPKGQEIMYERLSKNGPITVLCVSGDAQTMEVRQQGLFYKGKWSGWKDVDMEMVQDKIRAWTKWALKNPKL